MKLDKDAIDSLIAPLGYTSVVLNETDSTNLEAARRAYPLTKTVIIAERQTAGRGRLGRSFISPAGGLYMSALIPYTTKPVTVAAGVAVCRAIKDIKGISTKIKWVNDVYIGDKKICGILSESVYPHHITVGIGINIKDDTLPKSINAAALGETDRNVLAALTLKYLLAEIDNPNVMNEYRSRCKTIGETVTYVIDGVKKTAKAINVADNGGLVFDNGDVLTTGGLNY